MDSISNAQLWTGRVLSGIAIAFLFIDAAAKLMQLEPARAGTRQLGYEEGSVFTLGVLLMIGTILYAIPRTSVVGAIYVTGFLGGALATHFRLGSPLFTHTLFSVYVGAFVWGGLALRNPRLLSVILGS
jgi:DoxX-like family